MITCGSADSLAVKPGRRRGGDRQINRGDGGQVSFIAHPTNRLPGATRLFALVWLTLALGCDGPTTESPPGRVAVKRTVRVAAAADLKYALDEVVAEFQVQQPGHSVLATYGSSGNFHAQLLNRAPFDLFLSADMEYPRQLAARGLAEADSQFLYAVGRIVVWAPKDSGLYPARDGIQTLIDPAVHKIAIANPDHAPYGRAAISAMRALGVHDEAQSRLVLGENVAQAAQFIESGAAQVGIIALSLALSPPMRDQGEYWLVPLDAYPRMDQGGIVMSWAEDTEATLALRDFLVGDKGRAVLARYGFLPPEE
jgi:molybdate transport system substrate-binding protein